MNKTALHPEHLKLGAKMTEFHGWDMPLYYTSILEEHHSVRAAVGVFDISHMGQVWVRGPGACGTLNELVVSDLAQVGPGRACYTLLTNEQGGILDDLIIYRVGGQEYLVIVNCANREADAGWLAAHRRGEVEVRDISAGRSIVAVQGPHASRLLDEVVGTRVSGLGRFDVVPLPGLGEWVWVARTGYTGSDGFEVFLPDQPAVRLWRLLLERGAQPIGLGARDTLRLEAGLRLYGTDMDAATSPYEAGLGWTVAIHKPSFLGKGVLLPQREGRVARKFIGFEMGEGPVPRHGCAIVAEQRRVGTVTSGTFSATLNKPIGMGYVEPACAAPGTQLSIEIRARPYPAVVVKLPFVRAQEQASAAAGSPTPLASPS